MKYTISPKLLVALAIVVLFFGIIIVALVTPSVILDFFRRVTPDTPEELRTTYVVLVGVGAVLLFIVLRHKKPYKFKKKIKHD